MNQTMQYRPMRLSEEIAISDLVIRVFNEDIASLYSAQGITEFLKYAQPELLLQRSQANHFVLVAVAQDNIVGMIEVRDFEHICLLFVDKQFQRQGVAKELVQRSLAICLKHRPQLRQLTVNSSPNSVQVYEKLGFRAIEPERVINGIRFTPMALGLAIVRS